MSRPPVVLIVCTANQCRSPMAHRLLEHALADAGLEWKVLSAGTSARPGAPMHPLSARALTSLHVTPGPWSSRRLDRDMVAAADLVLTAEAAHRGQVRLLDEPRAMFTLLQFARLVRSLPMDLELEDLSDLVDAAREQQHRVQPAAPGADDLADPIGRRYRAHRKTARIIADAVADILRPLRTRDTSSDPATPDG